MDNHQHRIWLLDATKACLVNGSVDEKKLSNNLKECVARVRSSSCSESQEAVEGFKMDTTLIMILCTRSVRDSPVVQSSKDFLAILLTFPILTESNFFFVVRNQKLFQYLGPLMSYLPLSSVLKFTESYFRSTSDVTPVTLAITLELTRAICSTLENASEGHEVEEVSEAFKLILTFFSRKNVVGDQIKLSAYYFMYLCECTYLVTCSFLGKHSKIHAVMPTHELWEKLWKTEPRDSAHEKLNISVNTLKSYLDLCQENVKAISIDLWMEWSEVVLPASIIVHRKSVASEMQLHQNTIQSVVCNIAFDILRIAESHSETSDALHDRGDLIGFFKQVASDPDYDPDCDLPRDQLLAEINLKDKRLTKLLGFLLARDDVFSSKESIECLMLNREGFDQITRLNILVSFIGHVYSGKAYESEAVEMVIKLAEDLPALQLLPIIEEHLSSGMNEVLKTPDFPLQMTEVFNQLADGASSMSSSKHVWLCLQSGREVVNEAVRLPVKFSGLVNIMVQALVVIRLVCQAKGESGDTVVMEALRDQQHAGLQGREERDFSELVKGLIKNKVLENLEEVLTILIHPSLRFSSQDLTQLQLPLDLLDCVIQQDTSAVVKPGVALVSLVMTLAHIVDATATIDDKNSSIKLMLRNSSVNILRIITKIMADDFGTYERDISMLKQIMGNLKLHPRTYLALADVLDCKINLTTPSDCFLHLLLQVERQQLEGNPWNEKLPEMLSKASKEKWIIMLLQTLPHCSQEEWNLAFSVTHTFLKSGRMALHTLILFQKVLYLMTDGISIDQEDPGEEKSSVSSISLHHCFKCFANGAMEYLVKLMKGVEAKKKFTSLCSIFSWWCQMCAMYPKELESPSLLLLQLVTAVEELLNSKTLILCETDGNSSVQDKTECNRKRKNVKVKQKSVENGASSSSAENIVTGEVTKELSSLSICETKTPESERLASDTSEKQKSQFKNLSGSKENGSVTLTNGKMVTSNSTPSSGSMSRIDFRKQIEQVSIIFLKYVPPSSLSSSVASRLKKLHEISFAV